MLSSGTLHNVLLANPPSYKKCMGGVSLAAEDPRLGTKSRGRKAWSIDFEPRSYSEKGLTATAFWEKAPSLGILGTVLFARDATVCRLGETADEIFVVGAGGQAGL